MIVISVLVNVVQVTKLRSHLGSISSEGAYFPAAAPMAKQNTQTADKGDDENQLEYLTYLPETRQYWNTIVYKLAKRIE